MEIYCIQFLLLLISEIKEKQDLFVIFVLSVFIIGVLDDVKTDLQVGDAGGGLLQTAFVLSYMLFAPIFGYLGDRFNRTYIMAFGVFLWSVTTMIGSFMDVSNTRDSFTINCFPSIFIQESKLFVVE